MNRRCFVCAAALVLVAPALAQKTMRPWRVGYLSMAPEHGDRHYMQGLREGLRSLGYIEGGNLVLEQRHAFNDAAQVAGLARDLLAGKPDVLVVYGSPAIAVLVKEGVRTPIVMTVHADPVGSGVVKSLARPGGNITGLTDGHADLAPKRLELLMEVVPSLKRMAVLFNPASSHAARQWKLIEAAAPRSGVSATPVHISGPKDIGPAFEAMRTHRVEGVVFAPDPTWWIGNERRIAEQLMRQRLPSVASVREFAEHGVLIAYGTNFVELWRKAAAYVDKILKGAKPGDLAIEHPNRFELVINQRTARAIGLTVPRTLLIRADAVID